MVAIDMDGTLLNSSNEISERNKIVLKELPKRGVDVVISTGRIFTSALYYSKILGIKTPIIACNGAYIKSHEDGRILYENPVDYDDLKEVLDCFEEKNMYYHFYDSDTFYAKELKYNALKYYNWNKKQPKEDKIKIKVIDKIEEILENRELDVYKIVTMDKEEYKLEDVRRQLSINEDIEIVSSWRGSLDIMNKGVSKGNALKELCNLYSIKPEEVVAIGDNENDLSMLKFAGMGVAMGNGEKMVKDFADIITDTNDNDGVAKIIEKIF